MYVMAENHLLQEGVFFYEISHWDVPETCLAQSGGLGRSKGKISNFSPNYEVIAFSLWNQARKSLAVRNT